MNGPVVVLGANIDGLVAAHRLAAQGQRVIVLDQGIEPDGIEAGWVAPVITEGLQLARDGFACEVSDVWASVPLPDGGRLDLHRDIRMTSEAIARVSGHDARRWPEFCARMHAAASIVESTCGALPPDPVADDWRELMRIARLGLGARRLGRQAVIDLLRWTPMSVHDLLDDWFETPALKAVLAASAVRHLAQGPRASGTGFALLHRHVGCVQGVFAPDRSNLADVLMRRPGIELRRDAHVAGIEIRAGQVHALHLLDSSVIETACVVSALDVATTLTTLVDTVWLDPALVRAVRNVRTRGVVARVSVALDRAPGFHRLILADSPDHLQRAADDAKYGAVAKRPWCEVMAGRGAERASLDVHVQCAPFALRDAEWNDATSAALREQVIAAITAAVPELNGALGPAQLASPRDLGRRFGWPGGQAFHAELALDQVLWMRPVPALARHATPVSGLWLAGPGQHPGAEKHGLSGWLAAGEVLRSLTG